MAAKDEKDKKNATTGIKPGDETKIIPPEGEGAGPGQGGEGDGGDNGGSTKKEPKGDKKIEVSESLLRELIDSNKSMASKLDKLESNAVATGPNGIQVRRKTKEFDYTLRVWEGSIVLGFENMGTEKRPIFVTQVYNKDTRQQEQYVNLVLENEKETVKVDYITFLRDAERITARKISQVEHEDVKEYGMIPKKEMAENGYGMFETMVLVPVEVVTKRYDLTLRLPKDFDEREIVISSEWVNL